MKKKLFLIITLASLAPALIGCGGKKSQQNSISTQNLGHIDATSSFKTEVTVSEEPNTAWVESDSYKPSGKEVIGLENGLLEMSRYPELELMPTVLPDIDHIAYWKVGDYGYAPRIIKEVETRKYYITISVPEIPEKLRNFIQDRGESYIMAHFTPKSDPNATYVSFAVYYKEALVEYVAADYAYVLPNRCRYCFGAGDNILFPDPDINNDCMVFPGIDRIETAFSYMETPYFYLYWTETEPGEGDVFTPDEYDLTSYSPTDDKIDLVIECVQKYDWPRD